MGLGTLLPPGGSVQFLLSVAVVGSTPMGWARQFLARRESRPNRIRRRSIRRLFSPPTRAAAGPSLYLARFRRVLSPPLRLPGSYSRAHTHRPGPKCCAGTRCKVLFAPAMVRAGGQADAAAGRLDPIAACALHLTLGAPKIGAPSAQSRPRSICRPGGQSGRWVVPFGSRDGVRPARWARAGDQPQKMPPTPGLPASG
jgi:hypothetical protein